MLGAHDQVPHFTVTTLRGHTVRYADAWQHRPLVFVCLGPSRSDEHTAREDQVIEALEELARDDNVAVVITREAIAGLPPAAALVADAWGEIYFVATGGSLDELPSTAELADWLHWVRMKCPECEGEAK
jgi:hypothetical protein